MGLFNKRSAPALSVVDSATAPAVRLDRARRNAALAARDAKQREIQEVHATVECLQRVVEESAAAEGRASEAENAAKDALAERGRGVPGAHAEHERLRAIASDARREANDAAAVAKEAAHNVVREQGVLQSLRVDFRSCENEIAAAVGEILVSEARPTVLDRLERAAEEYREARAAAICLRKLLATEEYEQRQAINQRAIDDVVERSRIVPFDKERENPRAADVLYKTDHEEKWLERLTAPWRARAAQLRQDLKS